MPTPKRAPSKEQLQDYLSRKLTQQQMVDAYFAETGIKVSRSAIAMAMHRTGLANTAHVRHDDLLPWTLRPEHRYQRDARYLRSESRRRRGEAVSAAELRRLQAWKTELDSRNAVIHYDPDSPGGWWWIERTPYDMDLVRHPKALIPWDVKPEHQGAIEHRVLQLEVRRRSGEALSAEERELLRRGLLELETKGEILTYAPETGWMRVPREPEVDLYCPKCETKRAGGDRDYSRPRADGDVCGRCGEHMVKILGAI